MTDSLKEWAQVGAWFVAIIGGLIAAFRAIAESKRTNAQRRQDLRWKQADMAKKCVDEILASRYSTAALKMLDWGGIVFDVPNEGKTKPIEHETRRESLRTKNTVFLPGDDGPFIRDAFDSLFDGFERLEYFIRIGLITFEDVEPTFRYYVDILMAPEGLPVTKAFLEVYKFSLAMAFLYRFGKRYAA